MNALDQFAARELWVNWKTVTRKGKATKVPFSPVDQRAAETDNASTWGTRAQALRSTGYAGVGLVLGPIDAERHLGGVDLDACIDDEGDVAPWARDIVELLNSYCEVSPSGHGLKVFFLHDPRQTLAEGLKWRGNVRVPQAANGGKSPGIEFYLRDRYFAVTEQAFERFDTIRSVDLDTLRAVQAKMLAFGGQRPTGEHHPRHRDDDQQRVLDAIAHIPNPDLHWNDWNRIGMAIYAATEGSPAGYAAFLNWSAKASNYDRADCDERWEHWRTSPPDRLTAGTVFFEAKAGGWQDPRQRNGHDQKPPPNFTEEPDPEPEGGPSGGARSGGSSASQRYDFPAPALITAAELDELTIPPREWILGRTLLRGELAGLVGGGAVGKSSLILGMAVSVITKRNLIGEIVHRSGRCWVHNCEDSLTESRRRLVALLKHNGIPDEDIVGQLAMTSGLDCKLTVARKNASGVIIHTPMVDDCIDHIRAGNFMMAAFDPFIGVGEGIYENDNVEVDATLDAFRRIAYATKAGILIAHHTNKPPRGGHDPTDPNIARGAVAFVNGCRVTQQLTNMSKNDAKDLHVAEEDAHLYLRRDDGKKNLSLMSNAISWYCRASVTLANGDEVGVIVPHGLGRGPDISFAMANEVLDEMDRRFVNSAPNAFTLAKNTDRSLLRYLIGSKVKLSKRAAERVISAWQDNDVIIEERLPGEKRKTGLRALKRPGPAG